MRRPSFQFYPGDWLGNSNLKRCTHEEKGIWMDVLCVLHDQAEYGVVRWPLAELAQAAGTTKAKLRKLVEKGVLKGADTGQRCEPLVYIPRSGRKDGPPVTLIEAQDGPLWCSSRMVIDEHKRLTRGGIEDTPKGTPDPSPNPPFGEGIDDAPKQTPKGTPDPSPSTRTHAQAPRAAPSSSSSSSLTTTPSEPIGSGTAGAEPPPIDDRPAGMSAQEFVWANGVPMLVATGHAERKARAMLGKWVSAHGPDAVRDALLRCAQAHPVEPVAWMVAALGKPPEPSQQRAASDFAWWVPAGFSDRWDAENAGCTVHSAWMFEDGRKVRQDAGDDWIDTKRRIEAERRAA